MNNILDFPVKDPMKLFLGEMKQNLPPELWEAIGSIVEGLVERHGELPPFSGTWHPPGLEKLTDEEREAQRVGINNLLAEYSRVCRGPLLKELTQALIRIAELEKKLEAVQK